MAWRGRARAYPPYGGGVGVSRRGRRRYGPRLLARDQSQSVPDIFDEVQEDLRAEAARRLARRYSGVAVAVLVLILVGTGAFVWWQNREKEAREATASRYLAAATSADKIMAGKDGPGAADGLQAIAANGPEGYRTLARLRLAALDWQLGKHPEAVAAWQAVSDDGSAPRLLRDLATLSRLQHQVDGGDPVALRQQAEALTAPDNPWRPMAEQVVALLDIKAGRPAEALAIMQRLSADPLAPAGIREMAGDLMQTIDVPAPPPSQAGPSQAGPSPAGPSQAGPAKAAPLPVPTKGPGTH